jgi:hypothetical protein
MSTDAEAIKKFGEPSGAKVLDPEDVANSIIYALRQPSHVAVNEVLIEPRDEPIWRMELRKNGGVEIDYCAELYRGSSLLGIAELK